MTTNKVQNMFANTLIHTSDSWTLFPQEVDFMVHYEENKVTGNLPISEACHSYDTYVILENNSTYAFYNCVAMYSYPKNVIMNYARIEYHHHKIPDMVQSWLRILEFGDQEDRYISLKTLETFFTFSEPLFDGCFIMCPTCAVGSGIEEWQKRIKMTALDAPEMQCPDCLNTFSFGVGWIFDVAPAFP